MLDVEGETFDAILDEVVQDFIDSGHMNKETRDDFKDILYSQYVHNQAFHAPGKMNRRASIFNVDKAHLSNHQFHKESSDQPLNLLDPYAVDRVSESHSWSRLFQMNQAKADAFFVLFLKETFESK
jgi:hypothetical protein